MGFYYLLHKDIPVAMFELDENDANAKPKRLSLNKSNFEHLPLGAQMNNMKFIEWWQDRAIPKTRQGAKSALQRLGYKSVTNAMIDNLALSLNDCYWIKPEKSSLMWKDVNLYTNKFEDTFGELTFNKDSNSIDLRNKTKFRFAVSQGEVQKKWCIDQDGQRYMVKGNYGNSYQQSINEVFATQIHKSLGFMEYTPYYFAKIMLENNMEGLGCKSYNFCNEQTESISAWELLQTTKIKQNMSLYHPFKDICLKIGMDEEYFDYFMDYQILTDFLITNTDRHMNNISILRNPDTLETIGFAPIYDSGNSMFYKTPTDQLENSRLGNDKVHSFITSKEVKLLQYVKDRNVINLSDLDIDFSIYQKDVDKTRGSKLEELFNKKLQSIKAFQQGKDIWRPNINVYYSKKQILDEIEKDLETVDTMPDDDMPMPDNISDIHKYRDGSKNNNKDFIDNELLNR